MQCICMCVAEMMVVTVCEISSSSSSEVSTDGLVLGACFVTPRSVVINPPPPRACLPACSHVATPLSHASLHILLLGHWHIPVAHNQRQVDPMQEENLAFFTDLWAGIFNFQKFLQTSGAAPAPGDFLQEISARPLNISWWYRKDDLFQVRAGDHLKTRKTATSLSRKIA